jgi:hypothetical protein
MSSSDAQAKRPRQFSLLSLLAWTALVAMTCGACRWSGAFGVCLLSTAAVISFGVVNTCGWRRRCVIWIPKLTLFESIVVGLTIVILYALTLPGVQSAGHPRRLPPPPAPAPVQPLPPNDAGI